MKREINLLKNILILFVGTVIPKIASLISLPLITAYLSKAEYGIYDLIITFVSLFLPLATLQLQSSAFRYLIDAKNNEKKRKTIITNIIYFTFIFSTISLLILFFCLYKYNITIRILIILYYFLDIFVVTFRQISRGLSKNFDYSISVLINSLFELMGVFIFIVLFKNGLIGALLSLAIGQFFSLIYLIFKNKIIENFCLKLVSKNELKELISFSWPMIPNSMSSWIMNLSDRFLITTFIGIEQSAVYAIANKLPNLFTIVQNTFNLAWQENASIVVNDKDSEEYYGKIFEKIFKILVGFMAVLIGISPILFKILIKGDYSNSYNHMIILFLAAFFSSIASYFGGIYIAHKKSKEIGITTMIAAAFNFLFNLFTIKKSGIYAASISTLLSYFILAFYRMKDIQKIQKTYINKSLILKGILSLILMCIICLFQIKFLNIINFMIGLFIFTYFNIDMIKLILKKLKINFSYKRSGHL